MNYNPMKNKTFADPCWRQMKDRRQTDKERDRQTDRQTY